MNGIIFLDIINFVFKELPIKQFIQKMEKQQAQITSNKEQNQNKAVINSIIKFAKSLNWIDLNSYLQEQWSKQNVYQFEEQKQQKKDLDKQSIQLIQEKENSKQFIQISIVQRKIILEVIKTQLQNQMFKKKSIISIKDFKQESIIIQKSSSLNMNLIIESTNQQQEKLQIFNNSLQVQQVQSIIKIASKLFIQELEYDTDICIIQRVLLNQNKDSQYNNQKQQSKQNNLKYLFMIYQESYIQLKQQTRKLSLQSQQKQLFLRIKFVYLVNVFVRIMHQKIFMDVIELIHAFYQIQQQFMQQECNGLDQQNSKNEQNNKKWLLNLSLKFTKKLISGSTQYFKNQAIKKFEWNQQKKKRVFQLIKLILKCIHNQIFKLHYEQLFKELLNLTCLVVDRLQVNPYCKFLPSFYLQSQFDTYDSIYTNKQLFHIFGCCLIRQLPQKPQFSIIYPNYFTLINFVCGQILTQNQIEDLSLGFQNIKYFIVDLYQRFAILKGLLNKKDAKAQLAQKVINILLSKKNILSESAYEFLWRTLTQKHKDANFMCYCLSQYKKIITANIKPQNMIKISKFVLKLVAALQPNQNIQKIGTIITLTFYFLVSFKKINQKQKQNPVYKFVLGQLDINKRLQQCFIKLKKGLNDRIKILREKKGDNIEKDINELNICIYRIDQLSF